MCVFCVYNEDYTLIIVKKASDKFRIPPNLAPVKWLLWESPSPPPPPPSPAAHTH